MERVEMGLKSSTRKDLAMKLNTPAFIDELLAVSVQNAVSGADDFSVDDLLDLPNDDETFVQEETHEEANQLDRTEGSPVSSDGPRDDENAIRQTTDFSAGEDFSVPAEDLADLEWLSHFVEDSFSERSTPSLMSEKPSWLTGIRKQPEAPAADDSCFKSPVPAKARTKRARTAAGSVWFLGSTTLTDSSSSSSSTSSTSSPSSPWLLVGDSELLERSVPATKSASKKISKKKPAFSGHQAPAPRRCSHCGVQKTPQWRAGPMGAKTLCNACGVRYKSGRLLPEYRPACSPNFSSEMHSNSHRKVMEMRRKKENTVAEQVEPGLNQAVQTRPVVSSF